MYHAMIDLETLDTEVTAHVLTVGMFIFDPKTLAYYDARQTYEFTDCFSMHWALDWDEQAKLGRTISHKTVDWWLQQSKDAQLQLLNMQRNPVKDVLTSLSAFLATYEVQGVWGNGAAFDNAIMHSLSQAANGCDAWSHRLDRCYRTVNAIYGSMLPFDKDKFVGTQHNALDDAKFQAIRLAMILKQRKETRKVVA